LSSEASAKEEPEVIVAGGEAKAEPDQPSCFGGDIRVSALITSGGKVKVGIVDSITDASYLVGAGEMAGSVEVVTADYQTETVVLKRGHETCTLSLAADPNAPLIQAPAALAAMEDSPLYRGEAIENFLKEFPEAMSNGMMKFPLPVSPPAEGKGEAIDAFLREHPEIARDIDKPVVGRGEGIESFLRAHPEIKVSDEPIPEGSLGPGIEEAMRNNPTIESNAFEGMFPPPAPE
jgi:hypothetical protein